MEIFIEICCLTVAYARKNSRIEPTQLMSLTTTPMKKVVAGENHSMALSQTGQIFSWGSNSFGQLGHSDKSRSSHSRLTPKRIDAFRFHVMADIAASGCHSAAIDAEVGAVYTWGSNRRGQLGRKEGSGTDQADATPRSVDALRLRYPVSVLYGNYDSVRATKVALSDSHTCVVLQCSQNGRTLGQVWQFGYGSFRPSRVKFPSVGSMSEAVMCDTWIPSCKQRGMDIVDVSCAQNHSIALSADGSVYTWGHNPPALSHASNPGSINRHPDTARRSAVVSSSPTAPQKVPTHKYGAVTSVCASQNHCAVITQQGDLVTWGCGEQGVLGHGRGNTWQPNPKRVAGVKKAVAVAAGHQHMAVLVAPLLPKMNTEASLAHREGVPLLVELVEKKIMAFVDVTNCAQVWQYAERYAARRLQDYCENYLQNNWDVMLDVVGRERLEALFQLMLPPMDEPLAAVEAMEEPSKDKGGKLSCASSRKLSCASSCKRGVGTSPLLDCKKEQTSGKESVGASRAHVAVKSCKPNGRYKSNKFVPLTSFVVGKTVAPPTRAHEMSSPWGISVTSTVVEPSVTQGKCEPPDLRVPDTFTEIFPLPEVSTRKGTASSAASREHRASGGCYPSASPRLACTPLSVSGKHVLGYDGTEHEQVRAFSLDSFLKQPPRRRTRHKRLTPASPVWNSSDSIVTPEKESVPPKTLKEIQEEEEMAAARERTAKARISGGNVVVQRPQSTMNSWGLCRPPDRVSLTEVQKFQEEQEFVEQQRQILMAIEREQAQARADVGNRRKRPVATKNKRSAGIPKQERAETNGAGDLSLAVGNSFGDNERKRNKLKKAKERKAARMAAGETFAASGSISTRDAGRESKVSSKVTAGKPKTAKKKSNPLRHLATESESALNNPNVLKWAVAARNKAKLAQLKEQLKPKLPNISPSDIESIPEIIADSSDEESLTKMVQQTKVIMSVVGPYKLYGELLVKVCAENGVHYCDLTGEMIWIKEMISKYEATATKTGAVLVNCCGFESIPSDLATLLISDRIQQKLNLSTSRIDMYFTDLKGEASGGTIASVFAICEYSYKQLLATRNPYYLTDEKTIKEKEAAGLIKPNTVSTMVRYDKVKGFWHSQFIGAALNQIIVHRSNHILQNKYGKNFVYQERLANGGLFKQLLASFGLLVGSIMLCFSWVRALLKHIVRAPGQGPSEMSMLHGYFIAEAVGYSSDGKLAVEAKVMGTGDPGYSLTSRLISECAFCLAKDEFGELSSLKGGFYTPASAFGHKLADRLQTKKLITFELKDMM
ncbi:hypothetical protein PsorP6_005980 [Peronosclerospora sorghi]|uniref:Uncharacterized protein n=1 Tax=Peronosclerospora sorghi TaxID=230839 RepID=A0ACC0W669_9STRA|nr:hypothetical protein PsorP6_005980 [Peronosclerospora sorghi]